VITDAANRAVPVVKKTIPICWSFLPSRSRGRALGCPAGRSAGGQAV
jgi:hypothetical protein